MTRCPVAALNWRLVGGVSWPQFRGGGRAVAGALAVAGYIEFSEARKIRGREGRVSMAGTSALYDRGRAAR